MIKTYFGVLYESIYKENSLKIFKISSILDDDARILLTFGCKFDKFRRMMCRPTEKYQLQLDNRYKIHILDAKNNIDEMVSVVLSEYKGGIDYLPPLMEANSVRAMIG